MEQRTKEYRFKAMLRGVGFRATKQRVAMLSFLHATKGPQSVKTVADALKTKADFVTVYRALEALADKRIVVRIDLQHSHAHYELTSGRPHHHHLVCNSCGDIEDIAECPFPSFQERTLERAKKFASVQSHSLELFGTCNNCS